MNKNTLLQIKTQQYAPIGWRVSLQRGSWWLAVVSAVMIGVGYGVAFWGKTAVSWHPLRFIEAITPLCFALQAGFVLPPDSEPALEILSSTQRRLPLIALERFLVMLLLQCGVALIATFIGMGLFETKLLSAEIMRWLPPTLFFGGVIFFIVQMTRQGGLGALIAILLWVGLYFGGDAALFRWPSLQPIHAFLQPERVSDAVYAQNRTTLIVAGTIFTGLGLWLLRNEARVLGWRQQQDWHYWARRVPFYVAGTAVLLYFASVGLWIDRQVRRSEAPVCCATPTDFGFGYESVQLTSTDGIMLSGWYLPSQNGAAVIMLHGYNGHRAMLLPQAAALTDAGYGVLLYDLRGHSESGGDQRTFGWADVADVETAVSYLQSRPDVNPNRIGIFGFSMGGQIALRAAAQLDTLQAVVADGPGFAAADDLPSPQTAKDQIIHFANRLTFQGLAWRMGMEMETAVIDQIASIAPRPILFIATGPPTGVEQRLVQHFYNHAVAPKTIWTIPNAKHGTGFATEPEAYKKQMIEFFDSALLED